MTNVKELAAAELQRRLESMSTSELLRMMGAHVRARRSRSTPPGSPAKSGEHRIAPEALTVREAVRRAVLDARMALTSSEIVEAVQVLRPGTAEPTIRAEVSRMDHAGQLRLAPGAERRFRVA